MSSEAPHWMREPGLGRYARPERERRFFLKRNPPDAGEPLQIDDRYLDGLRLRLRHLRVAGQSVYKLTQKVRVRESDPAHIALTNVYLSAAEFRQLSQLPGSNLSKTRRLLHENGVTFAVDEFAGPLEGLRLAEAEVSDVQAELALPQWLGKEVTHDDRFSGGYLARAQPADASQLIDLSSAFDVQP